MTGGKISIGQSASLKKSFSVEEVKVFSELSLDRNPIHLDESVAKASVFGARVVHGLLVSSLFSAIIGTQLPGKGSIYLGQSLKFRMPVFIDEEVTARVEVIEVRADKPIASLKTTCFNAAGEIVIEGSATVKFLV